MFEAIFYTVFPLLAIVLVGFAFGRKTQGDFSAANRANMDVFTPMLIFSVLSTESFRFDEQGLLALAAAIVVLGSGLLVLPLAHFLKLNKKTFIPPMMFSNSGNLGLPLMVLAFGEKALPAAVVVFIVENTLHFTIGTYFINHRVNPLSILKIPMVFMAALGLVWNIWQLPMFPALRVAIDMLGQVAIPLMLFSLGMRMTNIPLHYWRVGILASVACPLSGFLAALVALVLLPLDAEQTRYLLLFSVLPPALLNFLLAERYQQQPQMVASIVLIANLASLAVIPLTLFFILPT